MHVCFAVARLITYLLSRSDFLLPFRAWLAFECVASRDGADAA